MLDSEFWSGLKERFRRLDPSRSLRAERFLSTTTSEATSPWFPVGTGRIGQSVHKQFIPLAQRGASRLPNPAELELLDLWLETLSPFMTLNGTFLPDRVYVDGLCQESEDLCAVFESQALEAEDMAARPRSQHFYPNIVLPPGTLPVLPLIPTVPQLDSSPILERALSELATVRPTETVAEQLRRLRKHARLTVEALAEAIGIDQRNVERHLSGESVPRIGNVAAYESVFSKALKIDIVIAKTPVKRR